MEQTKGQKLLALFERAKSKRQAKDEVWRELDAYDRNQQWDLEKVASWIPKPVTNYLHIVKYTKRAAVSVENPVGKLRPISPAGTERIGALNRAYENEWDRMKARKVVRQNIETSKLLGTAIAQIYFEEVSEGKRGSTVHGDEGFLFEGTLKIKEIEPSTFYPDPDAFTLDDCRYVCIRERKTIEWVKNQGNFTINKDLKGGESSPNDRGEIFLRDYTTGSDGLVDFTSIYQKQASGNGAYKYSCTYLVGDKIVHEIPEIQPNRYPFAVLYDFPQRQEFWGMSTCQFILDNQKIINKVESIIAMIGTLMQNPQKVTTRDSGIDVKELTIYGNLPGQVWQTNSSDPSKAIYYVQPPQIPQVLFNLLEQAKNNIREVTGLTEAYLGQNVGSLQTSSGVQSLIDRSTMRDRDQMYDLELYIEELTRLIIDFMVTHYDQVRLIRTSGSNPDEYDFEDFVGTDFADLDYDLRVDVSAKAPITRLREQAEAKELLQYQGQYNYPVPLITPTEFMKISNFANSEEIIRRMTIDEMRNKVDESFQVAQMMADAISQGVSPEEVMMMGEEMFAQITEAAEAGIGNAGQFQQNQQAPQ